MKKIGHLKLIKNSNFHRHNERILYVKQNEKWQKKEKKNYFSFTIINYENVGLEYLQRSDYSINEILKISSSTITKLLIICKK